jgi:hypothetical protein
VVDYSDRIGLGFGSLVGFGRPVGAGLAGQWLGQFAVRWAAVLCDTVVAVAVVVEIDLEVKESVVHYCFVVVIKSFGGVKKLGSPCTTKIYQ